MYDRGRPPRGPEKYGSLDEAGGRIDRHTIPHLARLGRREKKGAGDSFRMAKTLSQNREETKWTRRN